MGSQWNMMGKDLMKLPIFSAAIEKCHKVLQPKGINLKEIIIENNPDVFNNILNSFVGIAAVQVLLLLLLLLLLYYYIVFVINIGNVIISFRLA